ncbi:hypothetical protein ABFS82_07G061300 [Erythranthe guttata]
MNKINVVSLFLFCCIFCVVYGSETSSKLNGRKQATDWCISRPNAPQDKLQAFIEYGCGIVDCSVIQPGGPCYDPNTVVSHANYVLDLIYYVQDSCDPALGMITTVDPSYGDCKY